MIITIEFNDQSMHVREIDCRAISVNSQVRILCVHNHNGLVDNYNIDTIFKFTVPLTEVKTEDRQIPIN